MKKEKYTERELETKTRIMLEEEQGIGDVDIHNLELLLVSIRPGSYLWNRGCIKTLKKAIAMLERANQKKEAKPE